METDPGQGHGQLTNTDDTIIETRGEWSADNVQGTSTWEVFLTKALMDRVKDKIGDNSSNNYINTLTVIQL